MLSPVRRRIISLCLLPTIRESFRGTGFMMDTRSHLNIKVYGKGGVA